MKKLAIFGIKEFAEIAFNYFSEDGYEVDCFVVDEIFKDRDTLLGVKVVTTTEFFNNYLNKNIKVFVAMTYSRMNVDREFVYRKLKSKGFSFVSYLSKHSFIDKHSTIGENVFVFESNVIQYNSVIEDNVIIWSGNHLGHSCHISSNTFISSHVVISGGTRIGHHSFIGVNSSIGNDLTIAPYSLIGAGAVIIKSIINPGGIWVGNPANTLKQSVFEKYEIRIKDDEKI